MIAVYQRGFKFTNKGHSDTCEDYEVEENKSDEEEELTDIDIDSEEDEHDWNIY